MYPKITNDSNIVDKRIRNRVIHDRVSMIMNVSVEYALDKNAGQTTPQMTFRDIGSRCDI